MLKIRASLMALALASIGASAAAAQGSGTGTDTEKLDSIAGADVIGRRAVGVVAAVVKGDDTLLFKGYGRANLEWDVAMPTDAMFEIGSITKQFTAVAILKLRDAGKLSLDDDITTWLPDFDTRGNTVPLRRLLDHTSGIRDVTSMPEWLHLASSMRLPPDSMYALIKRQEFQFPTGTAQVYNNSAYWLLNMIIQKASGVSYPRYLEEQIFRPLGMRRSTTCSIMQNIPRRASGYHVGNGMVRRAPHNVPTWYLGSGVLCSSAGDLVTWLRALHGGKVLTPQSYAELISPGKLNDGTPLRYAMGLAVDKDSRGNRMLGHGGEIAGFASRANWYPDAQMAVVVLLNNSGDASPSALADELAQVVLPGTPASSQPFRGDVEPLVGIYKGPGRGGDMTVRIAHTAEGIAVSIGNAPPQLLAWVENLTFRHGSALLTFRRANGTSSPMTELRFDAGVGYSVLQRSGSPNPP